MVSRCTMSLDQFIVRAKRKPQHSLRPTTASKKRTKQNDTEALDVKYERDNSSSLSDPVLNDTKLQERKVSHEVSERKWRKISAENLDCDYVLLYSRKEADELLRRCEETLTYNEGQLARVQLFGKWLDIPRKQVAHGESGLSYSFSGNTVPAKPWTPLLEEIRKHISSVTGHQFNFVLVNRYKDGCDHMGEHKDDERELVPGHPIASLTLGQPRDFIFKHQDARGKNARRRIEPVKLELQHGSLLMMNHPTNAFWYHSLPPRKRLGNLRINMTFRLMIPSKCKPTAPRP